VVVVGSANVDLVRHGERLHAPGETVTDGARGENAIAIAPGANRLVPVPLRSRTPLGGVDHVLAARSTGSPVAGAFW
jgi:hypothetical protein